MVFGGGLAAALAAAAAVCLVLAAVSVVRGPGRVQLLGPPSLFDSNTPVQWDSSAVDTDISGIHRYFNAAGADLARVPRARTMGLAELPSDGYHVSSWSKKHRHNVGVGKVDSATSKGIWHSKDEAWAGIDEVFPTDTPYAFEEDHQDKGEGAKMKTFIDHVRNQLAAFEKTLPKDASKESGKDRATVASLTRVLEAGRSALARIEGSVEHRAPAKKAVPTSSLRMVSPAAGSPAAATGGKAIGLRAHYLSSESARGDIDRYFAREGAATERENERNARASGSVAAPQAHQLSSLAAPAARAEPPAPGGTAAAKAFASEFASELASALEEGGGKGGGAVPNEESCQLCVKVQHGARRRGARDPCECESAECRECPDGEDGQRGVRGGAAAVEREREKERRALGAAGRAVSATNAILRDRIAALEATNSIAERQGLSGAYGEGSDDAVWPSREPFAGKSEKIASGASGLVKDLASELGAARARNQRLKERLSRVEEVALEGAQATARQRRDIRALEAKLHVGGGGAARRRAEGLNRYGGGGPLERESAPFYDLDGHGGRGTEAAVRLFEDHPNQAKMDVGPHPIVSRD